MVEKTSDISSNSSIGSVFAPAAACDRFFSNAKERAVEGACDHNIVVAAAIRPSAANPAIIRRFMGNLRSVRCAKWFAPFLVSRTALSERELPHTSRLGASPGWKPPLRAPNALAGARMAFALFRNGTTGQPRMAASNSIEQQGQFGPAFCIACGSIWRQNAVCVFEKDLAGPHPEPGRPRQLA
ncbi:MAG: hypothetical protein WCE35_03660 [Bradyrhizobium sp.]